ncbi:putative transaldolase [Phaeomoniella chlamydospora]|uniref:Putative transaldolase n=1 Tax=Phaeomoniella chlamydospora TaxID=158046 RepID=A0A0G2F1V3_PHACM|nr:putative transaldolase [Phaeomoniella chlamydospora]
MEQAALAGLAGCTYIAPYVLELRVHMEPGYIDPDPAFDVCRQAQMYYRHHGYNTKVLAASLTDVEQLVKLAGIDHITISQPLLEKLSTAQDEEIVVRGKFVFQTFDEDIKNVPEEFKEKWEWVLDESKFRIAFTRRDKGRAEWKQIYAINAFCEMQLALEKMIREFEH